MTIYTPKPEFLWKPDPNVEAARALPGWGRFHRLCGDHGVFFDHVERSSRSTYRATAFTAKRRDAEFYRLIKLADGDGRTVVDAIASAYAGCGVTVPGAAEMLGAGLTGTSIICNQFEDVLG